MAETADHLMAVPDGLPAVVRMAADAPLRFTPNELAMIRDQTNRPITEILESDDRFRLLAWLRLRRIGFPSVQWDDLGDVEIEIVATADEPRDPTDARFSTTSPPSAGTGA